MFKYTPAILIGLFTGGLIVIASLLLLYSSIDRASYIHNLIPVAIFAAGLLWIQLAFQQSTGNRASFKELFTEGFKCVIIVTLIMVLFTGVLNKIHPEYANEYVNEYAKKLRAENNRGPAEIAAEVKRLRGSYFTSMIYTTIFGYLLIGSITNAVCAGVLLLRKK